ncbi:MAG: choice-of-anchor D domain-containing protein, partial [Deltaproteobacteria bacterium]
MSFDFFPRSAIFVASFEAVLSSGRGNLPSERFRAIMTKGVHLMKWEWIRQTILRRGIVSLLPLLLLCTGAQRPSAPRLSPHGAFVPGEVLVRFLPSMGKGEIRAWLAKRGAHLIRSFPVTPWHQVRIPAGERVLSIVERWRSAEGVLAIEPNYLGYPQRMPDDPLFEEKWDLHNVGQKIGGIEDADIDAPEAWERFQGTRLVRIGVIDTGVDITQADLAANIWTNPDEIPDNGIDDDENGYIDDIHGWDFGNDDNDPTPCMSHGTHVSGIAGAVGNNGVGVSGVNWRVAIVPLKVTPDQYCGQFPTSAVVGAIDYATLTGIRITNNSYGYSSPSEAMEEAIDRHIAANDALFVAAAGNERKNNDFFDFYPANYPNPGIVSVAATTDRDTMASFSSYGPESVDLAAPGDKVYSTLPGDDYGEMSGTSMATPEVAGAAAFLLAYDADLSGAAVKRILMETTDPLDDLERRVASGGRLNLDRAFARIVQEQPVLSTTALDFGRVWVGKTKQHAFSVINTTQAPVAVEISASGTAFSPDRQRFSVAPASVENVVVTFSADRLGTSQETLTVALDGVSETIELSGAGIAPPRVTASPTTITAATPHGTTTQRNFTLANSGGATLRYRLQATQDDTPSPARGGPDAYGHLWIDSTDPQGPSFEWIDISSTGIPVILDNDDYTYPIDLGFDFPFYGKRYRNVTIGSNGFLGFSPDFSYTLGIPSQLPDAMAPNNLIAPFWSDLDPTMGGKIYYESREDRFIVAFHEVPEWNGTERVTFEVILKPDGTIYFNYLFVGDIAKFVVGIENESGTDALVIPTTREGWGDHLAVRIRPDLSWVQLTPPVTGSLAPDESARIEITFSGERFAAGTYRAELAILSNDPVTPESRIPITFTVTPNDLPIANAGEDIEVVDEDRDDFETVR